MHRNITPATTSERVDIPILDLFEIERRARALRAQAVRAYAAAFWSWIGRSLENARRRREDEYLARSQSVAELETRLRTLERSRQLVRV